MALGWRREQKTWWKHENKPQAGTSQIGNRRQFWISTADKGMDTDDYKEQFGDFLIIQRGEFVLISIWVGDSISLQPQNSVIN